MTRHDSPLGVVLVGHGSRRAGATTSLERVARRLQRTLNAPVEPAVFTGAGQSVADAVERLRQGGASRVVVAPFFIALGEVLSRKLESQVRAARPRGVTVLQAPVLGAHPQLAVLIAARVKVVKTTRHTPVVLLAHGSPSPGPARVLRRLANMVRALSGRPVALAFLEPFAPTLDAVARQLRGKGHATAIVVPCFLHRGNHARIDVPRALRAASDVLTVRRTAPLGAAPQLAAAVSSRVAGVAAEETAR